MKLRRYGQFINESVDITDDLIKTLVERGRFWDEILNLDCSDLGFNRNYSDMCKRDDVNIEADFQKIQNYFDEKGFTLEKLRELFSEENNKKCGYDLNDFYKGGSRFLNTEPFKSIISGVKKKLVLPVGYSEDYDLIINPFSVGASLDSQNSAVDIYLYLLFQKLGVKDQVWLGGPDWGDIDNWDSGDRYSEAFIRYKYGYHQTEYGKLWMKQCQINEAWLREKAINDLQIYLKDEFLDIIGKSSDNKKWVNELRFDDYTIIEEDRIIFNLTKLSDDLENCPAASVGRFVDGEDILLKSKPKNKSISVEKIAAQFVKSLQGFSLDIELTDTDDLIIWGRFKED